MQNETTEIKKRIDLTFFAKILISVAICFLVYGFYLDTASENQLIDPGSRSSDTAKKGETITTIDIHHWDDDVDEVDIELEPIQSGSGSASGNSGSKSGNSGGSSGGGSSSGGGKSASSGGHSSGGITPGGNSGGSSSGGNSGGGKTTPSPSPSPTTSPSPSPSPSPTTSPSPSPSPSIDTINNNLRISIQNNYGVTIKYGAETNGYTVGGLSTNPITNASTINNILNRLNSAMSLYPNGFFREIKNGGIPLTLYLIQSYSEYGVTGVTDSNYSFANISIAVAYPFEETFFHESYHYIERYIYKKGIYYQSWGGYNPAGFTYGSLWRDQSFARTGNPAAYFVNDYAQTSAEEDRASTFEYMMQGSKPACLNQNMPVWNKARAMSSSIDSALNCVNPGVTEYWERHL